MSVNTDCFGRQIRRLFEYRRGVDFQIKLKVTSVTLNPLTTDVPHHKETSRLVKLVLKVQSCKLYNKKYMIASTQITKTEIFAFIAVLVLKLLSHKVLFINRKDNRNC